MRIDYTACPEPEDDELISEPGVSDFSDVESTLSNSDSEASGIHNDNLSDTDNFSDSESEAIGSDNDNLSNSNNDNLSDSDSEAIDTDKNNLSDSNAEASHTHNYFNCDDLPETQSFDIEETSKGK